MKHKKTYYILMFLPLVITVIALFFLPEQIPAHFGANNEVTRWGSKYEALLCPVLTIPFGLFLLEMGKAAAKQEKNSGKSGSNNEKTSYIAGIGGLLVFNFMNLYFLYADFKQAENLNDLEFDMMSGIFAVMGLAFIILGNIMPKMKRNSVMGLRTSWSMKNDAVWKKCQRFGGISFMAAGALTTIGCLFLFRGTGALIWTGILTAVMLAADIWYSWLAAKKDESQGGI